MQTIDLQLIQEIILIKLRIINTAQINRFTFNGVKKRLSF